jgi:hypothetical protein
MALKEMKTFLKVVVLLCAVAGLALLVWRSQEPARQRTAVLGLIEQLRPFKTERSDRAAEALRKLGTNALPVLLELIRTNDFAQYQKSSKETRNNRVLMETHLGLENGYRQAARAFDVLGPIGRPAVPALSELVQKRETAGPAARALAAIGPEAWTPLTNALASEDVWIRGAAASSLGYLQSHGKLAAPRLAACLKDPEAAVRYGAADSLTRLGKDAVAAVGALGECLEDTSADVRETAAKALGRCGSEASMAVPALVKATSDSDKEVRDAARRALSLIKPKPAAN